MTTPRSPWGFSRSSCSLRSLSYTSLAFSSKRGYIASAALLSNVCCIDAHRSSMWWWYASLQNVSTFRGHSLEACHRFSSGRRQSMIQLSHGGADGCSLSRSCRQMHSLSEDFMDGVQGRLIWLHGKGLNEESLCHFHCQYRLYC